MKNIILSAFLTAASFKHAQCQDSTTVQRRPFVTMTTAQQKQQLLLKRLNDYSYIIGRQFGKFESFNENGQSVLNNDSLFGKIVLVNFWFEGCSYCHNLFEPLNKLFDHYKENEDVSIISISFDDPRIIKKNIQKYNLRYPAFYLSDKSCHQLMVDKGFPANLLIDQNGRIVAGFGVTPLLDNKDFFTTDLTPKIDSLLGNLRSHRQ